MRFFLVSCLLVLVTASAVQACPLGKILKAKPFQKIGKVLGGGK